MTQIYFWEVNKNKLFRKSTVSSLTSSRLRSGNLLILQTLSSLGSWLFAIKLIHYGTNSNKVQVWTQICLNLLFLCQTASCHADRSGKQHRIKQAPFKPDASVFPMPSNDLPPSPLLLKPPVDKSFSFIAQTQGLQVHRPQKRIQGCSGGGGVGMGKRMVSRKMRGERNRAPYPGLTSTSAHPSPHPCLHPSSMALCFARLLCHMQGERKQQVALPGLRECVWLQTGVADWPWGGSGPFLLNQQRSSNDFTAVPTEVCLALQRPHINIWNGFTCSLPMRFPAQLKPGFWNESDWKQTSD